MKRGQLYLSPDKKNGKLSKYIKLVDTALEEIAHKNSGLEDAVRNAILSSGKRIRPVVSLLMCEIFCGDYIPALPVAVIYELAHTASLVQDDIIDKSEFRRGKPSIISQFGLDKAILTSDLLIFEIFNQLAEYEQSELSSKRIFMLLRMIGDSSKAAAIGEDMQLNMSTKFESLENEYVEMIRKKTGALLAAPAASGAIVGGASEEGIDLAYQFGLKLGIAYQFQDDLIDILGKPGDTGKPIFMDLKQGNTNFVIAHALKNGTKADKKYILGLVGERNLSIDDIDRARRILFRSGSIEYAMKLSTDNYAESRASLRKLKPCSARHKLLDITNMLSNKSKIDARLLFRKK
jgi:geranylgeranyl diphosphate synthase type I